MLYCAHIFVFPVHLRRGRRIIAVDTSVVFRSPGGPQEMVLKASERRRQLWSGSQVRSGLTAGGKGIRTIGPRKRISVLRKPPRPPSPPGEAVSPKNLPFLVQA